MSLGDSGRGLRSLSPNMLHAAPVWPDIWHQTSTALRRMRHGDPIETELSHDCLEVENPAGESDISHSGRVPGTHQYFSTGRISTAPPRRAAGIRVASAIAASMLSASYIENPPTPSARYVPFFTWIFPS